MRRSSWLIIGCFVLIFTTGCSSVLSTQTRTQTREKTKTRVEKQDPTVLTKEELKTRLVDAKQQLKEAHQQVEKTREDAAEQRQRVWKLEDRVAQLEGKIEMRRVQQAKAGTERIRSLQEENETLQQELSKVQQTRTRQEGELVIITVGENILFDLGKAKLKPRAIPTLAQIADIIRKYPDRPVVIQGHADTLPISTPRFPSNWHLSATRAVSVVEHLINEQNMDPHRLVAAGYGEYHPVAPNNNEANRQLNRRVEIVLYPPSMPSKRARVSQ